LDKPAIAASDVTQLDLAFAAICEHLAKQNCILCMIWEFSVKKSAFLLIAVAGLIGSLLAVPGSSSARSHRHRAEQASAATLDIRPTNIKRGTSSTLTVTSPSGLDLSNVGVDRVAITPSDNISHLEALHQQPGQLVVGFSIDEVAAPGTRTLIIFDANHLVAASATFNVLTVFTDHCPGQEQCCKRNEKTGLCDQCRPSCPVPPNTCPAGKRCCDPGPACLCTPKTQGCM
jgi:hypothetical protein